ncbi:MULTISPECIES: HD-GYP domain-containing protein [unclassified Butyrivibrio]|uniref:HD-GYP domain-containing protein n=1 Tax=unclassified Butyrivibrio TaxID=2639466 RepID=UPI0003B3123C|nr:MULTISPECIES: HD domain-containing phosphohydrolase [unclassified Butyrivibrio]SDB10942.1 HD domain-containing protein [Butyrivibrio sp. INlla16]SEK59730.1 HD domain-containing protein [Butyrivibrio sp. ob235]
MDNFEIKYHQQKRITDQLMHALARVADENGRYTKEHSERVALYSMEIARRMGKSRMEQYEIYQMGLLHDIGKIGVPDSITAKPEGLQEEEYDLMKKHPMIGAKILQDITEIPGLAVGARWHHERFDGSGYPDGLVGMAIPEEARIIGVADAYDAMSSERNYSCVMKQKKIRQEIEDGKGTQFDPEIADVLLQMIDDDKNYVMNSEVPTYIIEEYFSRME